MKIFLCGLWAVLFTTMLHSQAIAAAMSCESLTSLALPNATITLAQVVPAGGLSRPVIGPQAALQGFSNPIAMCRVAATLRPSPDSDIKIEVWMPTSRWNGKFQAVGNGGWAGSINYPAMSEALRRGYATSSTDTGHTGRTGSFALGHPEKLIDFGYRSVHEMTVRAKAIIDAFYGNGPRYSYWNGCSGGGRQGLMEAQRFPNDFDGIIAGAAANPRTRLYARYLWVAHATLKDPASYIPPTKYPMIHQAVLNACDAIDGLKDGLIDDPTRCHFEPTVLECKNGDGLACLTAPQVEAPRKIMSPAISPRTGAEIFPRTEPGSELDWGFQAGGPEPPSLAIDHFKYVVFEDPNWDWRALNFDTDVVLGDEIDSGTTSAINPNLKAFASHGGKLLMYHGWSDRQVPPRASINYYKSVMDTMSGATNTLDWLRLFMAPGMGHCRGGQGPNTFDAVGALEDWVENGKTPDQIIASHATDGKVDRTRPLCPYPQVARYKGTGSMDDAANFVCKMP